VAPLLGKGLKSRAGWKNSSSSQSLHVDRDRDRERAREVAVVRRVSSFLRVFRKRHSDRDGGRDGGDGWGSWVYDEMRC
jgi:hypothetical protein